jgi:hypothetical protein
MLEFDPRLISGNERSRSGASSPNERVAAAWR